MRKSSTSISQYIGDRLEDALPSRSQLLRDALIEAHAVVHSAVAARGDVHVQHVDCWRVRLIRPVNDPHGVRHGWRDRADEVVHHVGVRDDDDRVLVAPFRLFDELMFTHGSSASWPRRAFGASECRAGMSLDEAYPLSSLFLTAVPRIASGVAGFGPAGAADHAIAAYPQLRNAQQRRSHAVAAAHTSVPFLYSHAGRTNLPQSFAQSTRFGPRGSLPTCGNRPCKSQST